MLMYKLIYKCGVYMCEGMCACIQYRFIAFTKKIVGIKFRRFPEVLQSRVTSSKVLIHCEWLMWILSFTSGNVASDWTPMKWHIWCLFNKDSRSSCDTHVQISHHMALSLSLKPSVAYTFISLSYLILCLFILFTS